MMRNSGKPKLRCHPRLPGNGSRKTWMPGTRPGMATDRQAPLLRALSHIYRGRRREAEVQVRQFPAEARCGDSPPLPLHQSGLYGWVKLKPLSRRRPLCQPGPGDIAVRVRCASCIANRAGPCDAVIDVVRSRRLTNGARYFFFRRFLAPFFAAFAAFLRFFAMLPS